MTAPREKPRDPLLGALVDVATAVIDRRRLERAERRRRLVVVTDRPRARLLRWAAPPRTWRPKNRWALTAIGTLAPGERPINSDALVRLEAGGTVWRVAEASIYVDRVAGTLTVTLHLVEPETTLP